MCPHSSQLIPLRAHQSLQLWYIPDSIPYLQPLVLRSVIVYTTTLWQLNMAFHNFIGLWKGNQGGLST